MLVDKFDTRLTVMTPISKADPTEGQNVYLSWYSMCRTVETRYAVITRTL